MLILEIFSQELCLAFLLSFIFVFFVLILSTICLNIIYAAQVGGYLLISLKIWGGKKSPLKNQHHFLLRRSGPDVNLPGFNFLTTLFWTQLTPLNSIFSVMKWMQLEYFPCNYTEQPGEPMHLTGRDTQQILVFLIGGNQVKKPSYTLPF